MRTLLLALLTLPAPGAAQDTARLDEIVRARVDNKTFMGAVLVARGDDRLLSRGYGSANLEWNQPNTPTTKFRIASLAKQFTAAAILLLEERGKLKTEDPVKHFVPDAPAAWDQVTIFHLLTHSSGIPNYTNFPEYNTDWKFKPASVEKNISYFRDRPLDFVPGERMSYSNSGYILLGYLIERASGQSYETFLRDKIFTPLGMQNSGYDANATILASRASGYTPGPSGPVNAAFIDTTLAFGAGALYSTTEDLLRWTRALFGGEVLSAESLRKMTMPYKNNYAMGLIVTEVNGRRAIQHSGGIEGFNTQLTYYPDEEITVVVLGNLNGLAPGELAPQLGRAAHGEVVQLASERTEVQVAAERLQRLTGAYALTPAANVLISLQDGYLQAQLGAQMSARLLAQSETSFFARDIDAQIEFEEDANGAIVALVLHLNGRQQRAPRVVEPAEVALSPDVLARYAGRYRLPAGVEFTITLEDGRLRSEVQGQPKVTLYAESERKFFLKVANAQVEFVTGGGPATEMILYQGGRETRAVRQ